MILSRKPTDKRFCAISDVVAIYILEMSAITPATMESIPKITEAVHAIAAVTKNVSFITSALFGTESPMFLILDIMKISLLQPVMRPGLIHR